MEPADFARLVQAEAARVALLVVAKNEQYAGSDPLRCFRKRGVAGGVVRVEDKVNRAATFLERCGASQKDQADLLANLTDIVDRWNALLERGGVAQKDWMELFSDLAGYALCMLALVQSGVPDPHIIREAILDAFQA